MLKAAVLLVAVPLALSACAGAGKPRPIETANLVGLGGYLAGVDSHITNEAQMQEESQKVAAVAQVLCKAKTGKLNSYAADLKQTFGADESVVIHYLCPWRGQDYAQADQ